MAGTSYTRQSTFIDGDTITAALFNDEYNQLVNAFSYASSGTTGHQHDGTAGEGGNIHTIGDQDFLNKIVVDSTNNRWGVYVEVGGVATEQIRIQDGAIVPVTDNDIDLGTSSLEFKDLYLDGTANIDSLVADTVDINAGTIDGTTIGATSASTGAFTTLTASGDTTLSGALSVEGNTILGNAATDTVTFTADISSNILPSADSTYDLGDGSTYWANAYIDAVTTTGNVAIGGNLTVTGNATIAGNLTFGDAATDTVAFSADVASNLLPSADGTYSLGAVGSEWQDLYIDGTANIDSLVADTADINGGTIDSTAIGSTTASTGNFSTLSINGTAITSTAAELNLLDGVTATTIEINYLDGVTSNIQTQLDALQDSDADLTAIAALTPSDGNFIVGNGTTWVAESGNTVIASLGVTATAAELNYTDGVTSNIQTQLDTKAPLASPTFTGTVTADGLSLGDNEKATFGASNDLEIYHDGSHSRIDDTGTGNLIIRANAATSIQKYTGEVIGQFTADGSVDLYYDNAVKFSTTSTGIDVTGGVSIDDDNNYSFGDGTTYIQGSGAADRLKFITNASEAMRIDSSGNVGIGTSTVHADLHLGAASPHIDIGPSAGNRGKVGFDSNNVYIGSTSGTGEIHFKNNIGSTDAPQASGDTKMVITDSGVGIGTTSASSDLHIASSLATIRLEDSDIAGGVAYSLITGSSAGNIAFSADPDNVRSSSDIRFNIDGSERMRIDSSGNLLVGTTNANPTSSGVNDPGVELSNTGGVRSTVASNPAATFNRKTDDGQIVLFRKDGTTVGSIASVATGKIGFYGSGGTGAVIDSSGNFLVSTTDADTQNNNAGSSADNGLVYNIGSGGYFNVARYNGTVGYFNRTGTEGDIVQFRFGGTSVGSIAAKSGEIYLGSANTGVRFYDAGDAITPFDVTGATGRDNAIDIGVNTTRFKDLYLSGGVNFEGATGNTLFKSGSDLILTNRAAAALIVGTNNTERMRVDSSGNVGIGTDSPSSLLAGGRNLVVGSGSGEAGMTIYSSATNYGNIYFADGTSGSAPYAGYIEYNHTNNFMRFGANASEAMRIDSSGNVGIGVSALETTSSTRTALTIDNSFFAWGRDSYNEAGVAQGSYRNSAGNDEYRTTGVAASQVAFSAGTINLQVAASGTNGNTISWTDGLVVDNSGNVGIGATPSAWLSQASTLQLGGRVSLGAVGSNDDLHLTSNAYYNGTDWKAQETATASNYYMTAGTHVWRYAASTTAGATVSWSEAMRIGSSGDLLVAKTVSDTSTPGVRISGTSAGFVALVRDSGRPLYIRRNTTDGDIIEFAKDGTTVGSIGSEGGDSLYIGNGDVGLKFSGGADAIPAFNPSTGAVRDGAIDFGTSGARFKDLHLSGTANVANISETVYALTGTALDPANGGIQTKTLAANTTFTDSLSSGESLVLQLEAGASYTVTWPTITWVTSSGNTAPTLTAKDTLVFWKVSTTLYGAYTGSYV